MSPSDSGRGAIRWYEKNTNGALEDKAFINGLLVNRLKVIHSPHPRSLSAFVFNLKEMIISRLAIGEH